MSAHEFGIVCAVSDEPTLVRNVNAFLKSRNFRKLSRQIPSGQKDPDDINSVPKYTHYYHSSSRLRPAWYFDLYQNVDLEGCPRFPDRLDCSWTLFFNRQHVELNTEADTRALGLFQDDLIQAVGFSIDSLYAYKPRENRR
jgi:hypothetical protein